jgi:hypothetical protein
MIRRSSHAGLRNVAGILAWLIAVALFCWVAAQWIWRLAEPVPPSLQLRENSNWSSAILSGPAMGFTRADPAPVASVAAASPSDLRIRLLGIAREPADSTQQSARALFRLDKRVLWLKPGEELDPGVKLHAIDADGVRIIRDGKETRLLLREPRPRAPRGPAMASAPATVAPTAATPKPAA